MKKRNLDNLKLKKQTISNLETSINGGVSITIIYSYFQCRDIINTSNDYNGQHCDIATINDSCLSLCDDMCNDF
jgi:hypothetical protein